MLSDLSYLDGHPRAVEALAKQHTLATQAVVGSSKLQLQAATKAIQQRQQQDVAVLLIGRYPRVPCLLSSGQSLLLQAGQAADDSLGVCVGSTSAVCDDCVHAGLGKADAACTQHVCTHLGQ